MCSYKTLHRNEEGYVVYCQNCECMHIGFGTTVLLKSVDEFYEFGAQVEHAHQKELATEHANLKTILINTSSDAVTLLYSLNDLKKLVRLLNKAKERLTLEKLFVFHDN